MKPENSFSNFATLGPCVSQPESKTDLISIISLESKVGFVNGIIFFSLYNFRIIPIR